MDSLANKEQSIGANKEQSIGANKEQSIGANKAFRSRLPLPKSVFTSSVVRPLSSLKQTIRPQLPSKSSPIDTNRNLSSTCLKPTARSLAMRSAVGQSALRAHPYLSATVRPSLRIGVRCESTIRTKASPLVVTRLDFESYSAMSSPKTCWQSSETDGRGELSQQKPIFCESDILGIETKASKTTSPSIDWNSITKEAEVMALKTQINGLEALLEETKLKESQNSVDYELKIEKLNKEKERQDKKCSELSDQMKLMERKAQDCVQQLNDSREEFGRQYERYENRVNDLNKTVVDLHNQLSDQRVAKESIEARHRTQLVGVEHEVQTLETQLSQYSQEKHLMQKRMAQLESEAQHQQQLDSQLNSANADICVLKQELQSYKDGIKLNAILENELLELKALREENRHLNECNQSLSDVHSKNLILEERLMGLESQLKSANTRLKNALQNDVESSDLKKRLAEWQELMDTDSPTRLSKHLSRVQSNELLMRSELGSLKTQINELSSVRTRLDCDLRSVRNQLAEALRKVSEQNDLIRRLNRKSLLFAKEKDSYKRLIASYEHDITLDRNAVCEERIAGLESVNEDYRLLVQQLESELKEANCADKEDEFRKQISELNNQLDRYKTINAQLEAINKCLSAAPSAPDSQVYRVLHLNRNPLSLDIQRQNQEFKRLVDEKQRLETRLRLLETGCEADVSRQLDEGIRNTLEVEKLQQKLSSAEKRQQNIIDAFKRTSKEFREVCYRLTGFRIDLLKQNTYRLSHMYADSPNDALLFECDSDRTIKLLENDYSRRLNESVQTYLAQHDSFPAFLASLTIELFNKQTIV